MRVARKVLHIGEDVVYAGIGLVLISGAIIVLVDAAWSLATDTGDDVQAAIESMLDSLLLTFILVELLGAVRVTLTERTLVAEPFLLVGIIATIKELVVLAAFGDDELSTGDLSLELGTLAGVILGLSAAAWLVRRKEREPGETAEGP